MVANAGIAPGSPLVDSMLQTCFNRVAWTYGITSSYRTTGLAIQRECPGNVPLLQTRCSAYDQAGKRRQDHRQACFSSRKKIWKIDILLSLLAACSAAGKQGRTRYPCTRYNLFILSFRSAIPVGILRFQICCQRNDPGRRFGGITLPFHTPSTIKSHPPFPFS